MWLITNEIVSIGDSSKGKIISVYMDKGKDPPQTWEGTAAQQQSPKLQKDVTIQLLEQQQQIITLLTGLVGEQKLVTQRLHLLSHGTVQQPSQQQILLQSSAQQFPHHSSTQQILQQFPQQSSTQQFSQLSSTQQSQQQSSTQQFSQQSSTQQFPQQSSTQQFPQQFPQQSSTQQFPQQSSTQQSQQQSSTQQSQQQSSHDPSPDLSAYFLQEKVQLTNQQQETPQQASLFEYQSDERYHDWDISTDDDIDIIGLWQSTSSSVYPSSESENTSISTTDSTTISTISPTSNLSIIQPPFVTPLGLS